MKCGFYERLPSNKLPGRAGKAPGPSSNAHLRGQVGRKMQSGCNKQQSSRGSVAQGGSKGEEGYEQAWMGEQWLLGGLRQAMSVESREQRRVEYCSRSRCRDGAIKRLGGGNEESGWRRQGEMEVHDSIVALLLCNVL